MKTGFVLSGGGAKGCFQVGVLQKLLAAGIKPDVIYGTSTGSLQASALAYVGIEVLTSHWLAIKSRKEILKRNWLFPVFAEGTYSTKPLRKKVESYMLNEKYQPACEVVACQVDLRTGAIEYVSNKTSSRKELCEAIISSCSIPVIMDTNHGKVDGGVREQAPLKRAIEDGCDTIYVVLCSPLIPNPGDIWTPSSYPLKVYSILERTVDLQSHEVFLGDIATCQAMNEVPGKKKIDLKVIAFPDPQMGTLEFDPAKIRRGIECGRQAF